MQTRIEKVTTTVGGIPVTKYYPQRLLINFGLFKWWEYSEKHTAFGVETLWFWSLDGCKEYIDKLHNKEKVKQKTVEIEYIKYP